MKRSILSFVLLVASCTGDTEDETLFEITADAVPVEERGSAENVPNPEDVSSQENFRVGGDAGAVEDAGPMDPEFTPGQIPDLAEGVGEVVTSPEGIAVQPALAINDDLDTMLVFTGTPAEGDELSIWGKWGEDEPKMLHLTTGEARNEPAVCAMSDGGFAVVWSVDTKGTGIPNNQIGYVIVQKDSVSEEFRVDTGIDGNHWLGHVSCKADGGFVLAGVRPEPNDPTFAAFAREYDAEGVPVAEAVALNTFPEATETQPVVAVSKGRTYAGWGELEGRTLFWELGSLSPPQVLSDKVQGNVIVAGDHRVPGGVLAYTTEALNLKLHWIDAASGTGAAFIVSGDGASKRHTANLALMERPDTAALIYLAVTGTNTHVMLRYIGAEESEPLRLSAESVPPYLPAVAYRNGIVVAAWTERGDNNDYFIRVQRW